MNLNHGIRTEFQTLAFHIWRAMPIINQGNQTCQTASKVLTVFESGVDRQALEEDFQTFDWTPQHCPFQVKS